MTGISIKDTNGPSLLLLLCQCIIDTFSDSIANLTNACKSKQHSKAFFLHIEQDFLFKVALEKMGSDEVPYGFTMLFY